MLFKEARRKKALKEVDNERFIRYYALPEVKSLGFLFNINDENILDTIKRLIEIIDSRSIKFSAIAINDSKHPYPKEYLDHRIILFNKTDFNSIGIPKSNYFDEFSEQIFNLYIDFSCSYSFTCDYISRRSKASFKVGRLHYQNSPFDLVLDNIQENSSRSFLNSIIHYLSSIKSV
ncbi:MAG: hypothetical protein Q8S04_02670 [Bacteroidales bacterium]|nr:hypothetical protein [Bacteroidales bacterium]